MKRLFLFLVTVTIIAGFCEPETAYADMGPKPSITITIDGLEGEWADAEYYGTLLSYYDGTGPAWAYKGHDPRYGDNPLIWKKFVDYKDYDDFWFLQEYWKCTGNDQFAWTYYPPSPFKVLLYFPEYETFVTSGIYEEYAFDSYYEMNLDRIVITDARVLTAELEENYYFTWELISLSARVVITILLELLTAYYIFVLRKPEHVKCILVVNVFTQLVLNMALNIINYNRGPYDFTFWFVILEAAVFIIEAALYTCLIYRRDDDISEGKIILYAFTANMISLLSGIVIAHIVPGIF